MIREDREPLAELARLNREMAPLALRIMDASASADEQTRYAQRLIAAGERLRRRVGETAGVVIEGEALVSEPLILPGLTTEPYREP
ncbi:MAG TPA: hypothetical protein VFO16_17245 [Pseudonocardiaceae bacterium]|nr:hypothetical protein [Pseudonocardiaceae bacterium]